MNDLWPPVTGQFTSPWSTTPIRCEMLTFLCELSQNKKGREAWKKKKKKKRNSALFTGFPFPCRFLIPARQVEYFWRHPGFTVPSQSFGFVRVLKDSEEVSWNESSHRIWKDIEVSVNWIEGVTEFLLLFFFFYFTIRHPQWLWRRHSLSRSDSWSRPSGGISICSYFCESGE